MFLFPALIGALIFTSVKCTHEDDALNDIIDTTFEYGTDMVKVSDGYTFDKVHSSIRWETAYYGTAALLTGRFNQFSMSIEFDENNPENITLAGDVVPSTINSGEPGRDEGCMQTVLRTDTWDEATFASSSVEKDGNGGYVVHGYLTFLGVTSEVVGKMNYVRAVCIDRDDADPDNDFYLAGFTMKFDIQAKSVFGIESGHIADRITIICNAQFKKTMPCN